MLFRSPPLAARYLVLSSWLSVHGGGGQPRGWKEGPHPHLNVILVAADLVCMGVGGESDPPQGERGARGKGEKEPSAGEGRPHRGRRREGAGGVGGSQIIINTEINEKKSFLPVVVFMFWIKPQSLYSNKPIGFVLF